LLQVASRVPGSDLLLGRIRRVVVASFSHFLAGTLVAGLLIVPAVSVPPLWHLLLGRSVYVSVDGRTHAYGTLGRTVADVLREKNVFLNPDDKISPWAGALVWPGIQITVTRARPVTVTVGGTTRSTVVAAETVAEALAALDLGVRPSDRVYPDPSTALTEGMRITVERRDVRTWVNHSTIPFPSLVVTDPGMYKWRRAVRSAGQVGVREVTVQVQYADGRPVSVETLTDVVTRLPIPHVVAIGTHPVIVSRGPYTGREIMLMEATGYYPGPRNWGGAVGDRTAIGMRAGRGVVAVDPSVIPLRTRLHIEGYGDAVAGDTGGAIRGNRIDLGFNTYAEAIQFGRRPVTVYLLTNP